jgi:hypothetical protein
MPKEKDVQPKSSKRHMSWFNRTHIQKESAKKIKSMLPKILEN